MTSLVGDTVRLTRVLGHQGMDVVDDISSDRGREDSGQGHSTSVSTVDGVHIDSRTTHLSFTNEIIIYKLTKTTLL